MDDAHPIQQPPRTCTLILHDLPPKSHVGIDLASFSATTAFQGIKLLPPGLHHLWISPAPSLSLRSGFWIDTAAAPSIIARRYDPETESLVPEPQTPVLTAELWNGHLTAYRQRDPISGAETESGEAWRGLVAHVAPEVLRRCYKTDTWSAGTTSLAAGVDEAEKEEEVLTSLKEDEELAYSKIDLKRTWPEGAVGRERTLMAKDYSWAMEQVLLACGGEEGLLGEWELAFVLATMEGNYPSLVQWKRILCLVLGCRSAVKTRLGFYESVLVALGRMLAFADIGDGAVGEELDEVERSLRGFARGIREAEEDEIAVDNRVVSAFEAVGKIGKRKFDWIIDTRDIVRRGTIQTEEGDLVELEMDEAQEEDETGEYAPVIVEEIREDSSGKDIAMKLGEEEEEEEELDDLRY